MKKGARLRAATPEDHAFLTRLYASTRTAEMARTGWPAAMQEAFLRQQFDAQTAHYWARYPNATRLVIERAGTPAGRLFLDDWEKEWRIIDIALMPEARGHGLGTALLQDIQEMARTTSKDVSIHVEQQNPAKRLYKRLGFDKAAEADAGEIYELMVWRPLGSATAEDKLCTTS